ncbi:helix-turn-helix domain-containing protein [Ligilactobacillus cholophilus]|uniref:helix-turn-helix domain-containing protein n=1 Tax=Ligilactobacillus cholophilus TaxID=3050131 RepID=UPI0025B016CD|nr:helix-turn-helix domain-containing protein [Ligilactobacillus cholophilus]
MTSNNKWLTYKQAMDYLQIRSYTTLYKFIADGLKVSEIGKVKRISTEALDEFMNEHTI